MLNEFLKKIIKFLTNGKYEITSKTKLDLLSQTLSLLNKKNSELISKENQLRASLKCKELELNEIKKNTLNYIFPILVQTFFIAALTHPIAKRKFCYWDGMGQTI